MIGALWASKTGLEAQQTRMAVVSNNIANVNTTGFKRGRAVFEDLLYQNVRQVGAQTSQDTSYPTGMYLGTGVRVVATEKLYTQGGINQTGGIFDLAVQGQGFFEVLMPDGGSAYTRDGSFQINADGQLVTASGYQVQPPVTVPSDALSVTIGSDGTVTVTTPGSSTPTTIGQLQLSDFVNAAGLEPRGQNLFAESAASGAPQVGSPGLNGLGTLVQGALETSNVNVVEELVNMIETQRAYEMNARAISTIDQMAGFLTSQV
ncbi:MAG: flagellar basal-body rod protein FlgG [Steroidobacteraceae bacterium]|jgi:flagellar basal-body rod protein FlgG|nr:flagellar basal-body rod protein FlgG [Steroidobacteraceae bacterium]